MTNSNNSTKQTRSSSPEEDAVREERNQSRVNRVHGGQVVESIAPEEIELMNEPDCKHPNMVRDPTETDFNAFMCDNPKCGVVAIVEKV